MKWIYVIIATVFLMGSAMAQIADCDRLAANPPDPDRVTQGVPRSQVDLPAAIAACQADFAAHPDIFRFAYQLGRVYFYAGDTESALRFMGVSAEGGYRQAEFVYGAFINNRREGVPYNICEVEDYWLRSSRKGHVAARISYVRLVTKGVFEDCKIQATPADLRAFINIEMRGSSNYLSRLLVADLSQDVENYLQKRE